MLRLFHSPTYGQLELRPGLPEGFAGPFLTGTAAYHYSREFGSIVMQEWSGKHFSWQFFLFHFFENTVLFRKLPSGFYSFFAQQGESHHALPGKKIRLREGQFMIVSTREEQWRIELAANKPLQLLAAQFNHELVIETTTAFPNLQQLLRPPKNANLIGHMPGTARIRDVVHQILFSGFEHDKLPVYYKSKVPEYLFLQLYEVSQPAIKEDIVPTTWELNAVYKIRDLIISDLSQHHRLPELCRRFKMTPLRLSVFFKREFGEGPYAYLLNARLDKLKELLESGVPLKEAAPMVGYDKNAVISAFKNRFGYRPGEIKKRKK